MLCLFKNSKLSPTLQKIGLLLSLLLAGAWLYFSLITKNLLENLVNGKAIMVDVLLALPLTLFFAVIIYAFSYWVFKLIIILLFRQYVEFIPEEDEIEDSLSQQEAELGEDYWHQEAHKTTHMQESQNNLTPEGNTKTDEEVRRF